MRAHIQAVIDCMGDECNEHILCMIMLKQAPGIVGGLLMETIIPEGSPWKYLGGLVLCPVCFEKFRREDSK